MDMTRYYTELQCIADQLRSNGVEVSFRGEGLGRFLLAELGERGAELYRGNDGVYIVDPAEGESLLGEVCFGSVEQAVEAMWCWLRDAKRPTA